jgi:hypothetical protein
MRSYLFVALSAAVIGAYRGYKQPSNNGLGQDWDCTPNPYADVCIKRVPSPNSPKT